MKTEQERQKAVAWALAVAENTPIAPDAYELALLDQFVRGVLTLDQVEQHLLQRSATPVC